MEYDKLVDDTLDSIQKPLYEIDHDKLDNITIEIKR